MDERRLLSEIPPEEYWRRYTAPIDDGLGAARGVMAALAGMVLMVIVVLGGVWVGYGMGKRTMAERVNAEMADCQGRAAYPCRLSTGASIISLCKGWVQVPKDGGRK